LQVFREELTFDRMPAILKQNRFTRRNLSLGDSPKARFRQQFQHRLCISVRRGYSVERAFGAVWVQTLEAIALPDEDQAELYEQLLDWAKYAQF
jgi:hypothetical protein